MMAVSIVLSCLLMLTISGGNAKNYILDITVNCGTAKGNDPVLNILTDVAISARARCYGGDQTFTTTDKVHYTLPGTLTSAKKTCRWHQRTGSYTYAVDVLVRYGEVGSLILTKDKITTVVCTYDQYGKDASPQHQILDNFIAPRELGTIVGSIVPSSQLKLSIQDVHNADVKGDMNIDRKYTIYGQYSGPSKGVGLKPVHCDAVSSSGKRYAILRAGCGDGLVFRKTDGFTTSGKTFRSPYFEGYHLDDSESLSVECNVTLCTNCAGSSCATVCNGPPTYVVANGRRGSCVGEYKYKSTCTYVCNAGYGKKLAGISTCGPDGIWTVPQITCVAKSCGTPPNILYGYKSYTRTDYPNVATYRCATGYNIVRSARVQCLSTGEWSTRPQCSPKNCGTPPNIPYGTRMSKSTLYPNAALYRCNAGYNMVGSAAVRCLSTGSWAARPSCRAKNCGTPPNIPYGTRTSKSTLYPNAAIYTCNAGYNMVGSAAVRCLSIGSWASRPSCRAKSCGRIPTIVNGAGTAKSTLFPSVATYTCKKGTIMKGSKYVKCMTSGKWAVQPKCVVTSCAQLKLCNSEYRDGEYWIQIPKLNRMRVYCYGLRATKQQEYITLQHPNSATRPNLQYQSAKCNLGLRVAVLVPGSTIWNKIALNILTGKVVVNDFRYTKQVNGSKRPYGSASACSYMNSENCPARGHALVDLRDTGFMLDPKLKWIAARAKPKCNTIRRTNHIFEGKGDGYCGGCYPSGGLTLAADLRTAAKLKATEPVCRMII
ncbi:uncharacterized protein LOC126830088 isoform X2 [Patella vulgata]|uniref:uncharacterized protein LOC126830088 isoform X2 n=1 Tax=Patella vulgata TaxID=6465 RepID=UPI0024A9320B|nr:uncharacterized protein LOC126830088 isoform X2 [Patella vulgata]